MAERPPWEQRIRNAVGNPKLPKLFSEDFTACLQEIDRLREENKALKIITERILPLTERNETPNSAL